MEALVYQVREKGVTQSIRPRRKVEGDKNKWTPDPRSHEYRNTQVAQAVMETAALEPGTSWHKHGGPIGGMRSP